jgi:phosphoribosylaminoimidazole-succinocarboxamide synthase
LEAGALFPAPLFTPSTKAGLGFHDQNISYQDLVKLIGFVAAHQIRALSLSIYCEMERIASLRGIEILDTKFEFGYTCTGEIMLIDAVGTSDESRFNPAKDKQRFRNWLMSAGFDKKTPIHLPDDIVDQVSQDYIEGCKMLTGITIVL